MEKEKRKIIFISASRDLQYALELYNKHYKQYKIIIVCIKIKSIYQYIKSLNLNVEKLLFIPYKEKFNIKNPFNILQERKRLKKIYKQHLSKYQNEDVYFFTVWFDWIVFSFIRKLTKNNNKIFFVNYATFMPIKETNKLSIKQKTILILYSFITGSNQLGYIINNNKLVLFFLYQKGNITEINPSLPDFNSLKNYLYKIQKNNNSKTILFLENNLSQIIINFKNKIIELLNYLKNAGYVIYIKGHPNWGYSICDTNASFNELPRYIPVELIDVNSFDIIIGIKTHALIDLSERKENVYSLINLFEFKNKAEKKHWQDILLSQTNGKLKFIQNINELCL